jgi:hypothetical protein
MTKPSEELSLQELQQREDAQIRVLGRALIMTGMDHEQVMELGVSIALLTAGTDPNTIDHSSPGFKAGAALALETVSNSILELKPTLRITEP